MKTLMEEFDKKFGAWFIIKDSKDVVYKDVRKWILENFIPKKSYYDLFNETSEHYEDKYKEGFAKGFEEGKLNALDNYVAPPDANENL